MPPTPQQCVKAMLSIEGVASRGGSQQNGSPLAALASPYRTRTAAAALASPDAAQRTFFESSSAKPATPQQQILAEVKEAWSASRYSDDAGSGADGRVVSRV